MIKRVILALAALSILLAACQPGSTTPQTQSGPPMEGCTVQGLLPEPDPTLVNLIPAVQKDDHVIGKDTAAVTFIEYSDFQCPYCAELSPVFPELVEKYPDDVRVVFRHFPLSSHSNALSAAYAAEAATLQDKFFEMEKAIFANQEKWAGETSEASRQWLLDQAAELGMDPVKLGADMDSDAVKARVERNLTEATQAQLPGTPFLFINQLPYQSGMDIETLSGLVELFKLENRQYTACPPMVIDPAKQYEATMETEKGEVTIKLFADKAPLAVNSFVFLAREGWFNNVTFHRVLPGFVAQGGDPSGSGFGGPGYVFKLENTDTAFDRAGLLAMANSGPDTNGSQFFITYAAADNLNGGYTLFGEVTAGMDVVEKLTPRDPESAEGLPPGDKILSVTISEN
jgi:cyclophilin family peptidyl-prolyl cis-trans isomerase/protein-disulfide isomerase